jgi:hypothetical protein
LLLIGAIVVVNPILAATTTSGSSHAQHIREAVTAEANKTRGRKAKTSTQMQLQQSIRLNRPPDC